MTSTRQEFQQFHDGLAHIGKLHSLEDSVSSTVPRTDGYRFRIKHLHAIFTTGGKVLTQKLLSLQADEEPRWNNQARRY